MRKTMSRLFMAVLMVALLVSASIMSVSAANEGPTCDGTHGEGWTAIGAGDSITAGGKYYLTEDRKDLSVKNSVDEVTLCLCGHDMSGSWTLNLKAAKSVNLVNCKEDDVAVVSGDSDAVVVNACTVNVGKNVKLTSSAQAVYVQGNGTLNIYGGTIEGTSSAKNGAGIYLSYGTINMYDGTITGTTTGSGGGVYVNVDGTFNMYGGTISGCSGKYGGGVRNHGTFNMYGGTISGNTATQNGSAIYFEGTTNVVDGTIAETGLGITSNDKSTFIVSGGEFATKIWLGGKAEITGGKFSNKPDDAWLVDGYVTADVEDGDYLYKVCADGFYTSGEYMDFGSSLALGLSLNKSAEGYTASVTGGYKAEVVEVAPGAYVILAKGIAAKAMDEKITYTITNEGGEVLFRKTVSIREAAEAWAEDEAYTDMVTDMINYGREAQLAFLGEYKMDALGETETVARWTDVAEGSGVTAGHENNVAVTLSLKDQVELNVYVKGEVEVAEANAEYDIDTGKGITRISFNEIPVIKAGDAVQLTLSNGAEISFSITDYCALAKDGEQGDLVNALLKYIESVYKFNKK